MKRIAVFCILAAFIALLPANAQVNQIPGTTKESRAAGEFYAPNYFWRGAVSTGNAATGSATVILGPSIVQTPDGRSFHPFGPTDNFLVPVTFDMGAQNETITPTAVSVATCPFTGQFAPPAQCISFTGSFSFTHGTNTVVASGSAGAQEAALDALGPIGAPFGSGGIVVVDNAWAGLGGNDSMLSALIPLAQVTVADKRTGVTQYWTIQGNATVVSAPTTLTVTTVGFGLNGANTTGGTYNGASTYHVAVACVDAMGNESQPSADFSGLTAGSGTTNQIGIAAPAAQTGCVGWVPYISLAGGTYALAYRVPVATYLNGVATPNGVCALTPIETVTAACKITNTTYGQVGSNAIVSALTVNTARIWVGVGGTSSTSDVVGNSNARTIYTYASGSHVGLPGIVQVAQAFSAATAPATTVPAIVGTIHLRPGYMNFVGKTIRICGTVTEGAGSTATVQQFSFYWNADGSNTTGAGVLLPGPTITTTLSATPKFQFCQNLTTTVSGAGATAGSIQTTQGYITSVNGAAGTAGVTTPTIPGAATGSLNLAQEARIDIDYLHTTGTDGAPTLTNLSVEVVN